MNINQQPTEDSIEQPKKEFKSSFKTWIRAVAFIVIAVFLPEQAAQAMGYDPTTIWNHAYFVNQGKNGFLTYLVADNIKRSLDSLSYKQLNQVQLDKNLVVETAPIKESDAIASPHSAVIASGRKEPSNIYGKIANALQTSSEEILHFTINGLKTISLPGAHSQGLIDFLSKGLTFVERLPHQSLPTGQGTASSQKVPLYLTSSVVKQISLWLKDPKTQVDNNCGINALNALFVQSGIKVTREELATRAIMVDFLSGNLREFKGELALSLFALHKTAVSFGLKTALVKIPAASLQAAEGSQAISSAVPFITYLLSEHFVLVTRVTDDKIYYKEDKEETHMPKEIFLKGFTGNCLVLDSKSLRGSQAISLLSDQEALQISGKESSYDKLRSYIGNTAKSGISTIQSYATTAHNNYTAATKVSSAIQQVTGISISSIATSSLPSNNPLSAISIPATTYNYLVNPSTKGNLGTSYGAANTLQTDFALTVPKRIYDFTGWVDTVSGLNSNLGTKLYQSSSLARSISDAYSGAKGRTESSLKQTYGTGTYNNFIQPTEYFVADTAITTVATLGAGSAVGLAGGTLGRVGSVSRIAEPIISRLPQLSRITELAGPRVVQGLEWAGTKGWSFAKWAVKPEGTRLLTGLKYTTITGPVLIGGPTSIISNILYATGHDQAGDIISAPNMFAYRAAIETHDFAQGTLGWVNSNTIKTDIGDQIWNDKYGKLASVTRAWDQFDNKNKDYWVKNIGDDNYKYYLKPAARAAGLTVATFGVGYALGGASAVATLGTNALRWLPTIEVANVGLNSVDKYWTTGKAPTFPELTSWGLEAAGDSVVFSAGETTLTGAKTLAKAYQLDRAISAQKYYTPIYKVFPNGRIITAMDMSKGITNKFTISFLTQASRQFATNKITSITQTITPYIPRGFSEKFPMPRTFSDSSGTFNISSLFPDFGNSQVVRFAKWGKGGWDYFAKGSSRLVGVAVPRMGFYGTVIGTTRYNTITEQQKNFYIGVGSGQFFQGADNNWYKRKDPFSFSESTLTNEFDDVLGADGKTHKAERRLSSSEAQGLDPLSASLVKYTALAGSGYKYFTGDPTRARELESLSNGLESIKRRWRRLPSLASVDSWRRHSLAALILPTRTLTLRWASRYPASR